VRTWSRLSVELVTDTYARPSGCSSMWSGSPGVTRTRAAWPRPLVTTLRRGIPNPGSGLKPAANREKVAATAGKRPPPPGPAPREAHPPTAAADKRPRRGIRRRAARDGDFEIRVDNARHERPAVGVDHRSVVRDRDIFPDRGNLSIADQHRGFLD